MEWRNPYNSFNSYKGLLYKDQFEGMLDGKFLPPVEVNIDPCGNCQLDCVWCNAKNIISRDKKVAMTREHLLDLVDFCGSWGVKAICFAGGGEPTLHPDLAEAMERTVLEEMECAIITNGLFKDYEQKFVTAQTTRWCGVSLDAATRETYNKLKKLDKFDEVIKNMRQLADIGIRELTYKFLIHPGNQHEIFPAAMLARDIGCNTFHTRILSERYLDPGLKYDYGLIEDQVLRCHEIAETEKFKVMTISHKQEGDGNRRIRFKSCRASPLLCMFEADGSTSICIDRKGDPDTTLCSHDNPEAVKALWGSEYHKELLDKIDPEKDCKKCTMCVYQELLEAYERDAFCSNFP